MLDEYEAFKSHLHSEVLVFLSSKLWILVILARSFLVGKYVHYSIQLLIIIFENYAKFRSNMHSLCKSLIVLAITYVIFIL